MLPAKEIYRPPQQDPSLVSPPSSSWEEVGYKQSIRVPGTWPKSLFSNQTGDGNRDCRPNSRFPQIDQETQGPGANKTARAMMQAFSHCRRAACPAGGERQMEREARRRQRRQAPLVQGIPAKVVSHPRRLYRDHCVLLCVKRLPVPTVEHLSTEREPSSRSGPEDRCALSCIKRSRYWANPSDDTINSGSLLCLRPCCKINDGQWNELKRKKENSICAFSNHSLTEK